MSSTADRALSSDLADLAGEVPAKAAPSRTKSSLKARAARGSLWALAGHGGTQLLRLAGNLVLWRLLYPDAFGLMAIVNVFMQGLAMFSDVGIGPSIIQNKAGSEARYVDTAWTIQAARGFALFAVAVAAAVPVARFYGEPQLAVLIPAVSLGSILAGFNSTKLFTAARDLSIGRLTAVDLLSQGAGLVVMVAWALASRSIWALAAGGLGGNLVRMLMSHALLPGQGNRLCWDKSSAATLLRFGRWIFMSTLLSFVVMQSDRLIFGKLVSMSMLGVYSIATIWASFPSQILAHVFQSVLFPTLSRVHNEGGDVGATYREMRATWLMAAGWLTACLVSGGPTLVRFLYDERAAPAGPIIQILSVGTWFLALEMSNGAALLARGKPNWVAYAGAAKLAGMAVLIPAGMAVGGFPGAVCGFAASELFRYFVSLLGATRLDLRGHRQDLLTTVLIAATTLLGVMTRDLVRPIEPAGRLGAFAEGFATFAVVSAAWGAAFAFTRRRRESLAKALLL